MDKYPMIPRVLQASATLKQQSFSWSGSTEDWGIDNPQQLNGEVEWTWSPMHFIIIFPVGSMNMSTVKAVTLSEGGQASIIPPEKDRKNSINAIQIDLHVKWDTIS